MTRNAFYAGSFDPFTNGHLDIIHRATELFDNVVVGVGINSEKPGLFSAHERVTMIQEALRETKRVSVVSYVGLTAEIAKKHKCEFLVRGLRDTGDFVSEMRAAQMNRHLNDKLSTIFIPTSNELSNVSSSLIKEVARFGGDVSDFLPSNVAIQLKRKIKKAPKTNKIK